MSIDIKAREGLREWLCDETECEVQEGANGKRWPCGTCVMALLTRIGLVSNKTDYDVHNDPVERHNEVWRAILQIRDA